MAQCRVCGNKITNALAILIDGAQYEFDCLECAKQALAPACIHCGRLLNEQAKQDQKHVYYCCEACAEGCELVTHSI